MEISKEWFEKYNKLITKCVFFNNELFIKQDYVEKSNYHILIAKIISGIFKNNENLIVIDDTKEKLIKSVLSNILKKQNKKVYWFLNESEKLSYDFVSFTLNVTNIKYGIMISYNKKSRYYNIALISKSFKLQGELKIFFEKFSDFGFKYDDSLIADQKKHFLDHYKLIDFFIDEVSQTRKFTTIHNNSFVGVVTISPFLERVYNKFFYHKKIKGKTILLTIDKKIGKEQLKKIMIKNRFDFLINVIENGLATEYFFLDYNKEFDSITDYEYASILLENMIKNELRNDRNIKDYKISKRETNSNYFDAIAKRYNLVVHKEPNDKNYIMIGYGKNRFKMQDNNIKLSSAFEYSLTMIDFFNYIYSQNHNMLDYLYKLRSNYGIYINYESMRSIKFEKFQKRLSKLKAKQKFEFIKVEKEGIDFYFGKFIVSNYVWVAYFYKNGYLKSYIEAWSKSYKATEWEVQRAKKLL